MEWDLILQVTEGFWDWTMWMDLNMPSSQQVQRVWDNPIQTRPQLLAFHWTHAGKKL